MKTGSGDKFANMAVITVTESAANTLTFKKLETGISIHDKVGWIINRVEYFLSELGLTQFADNEDLAYWGLACSNSFAAPSMTEETILDVNCLSKMEATDVGFFFQYRPFIKDFSTLPGGGLLVPPVPLYLWLKGTGLAGAGSVTCRMHYTLKELSVDEYWELVEARRVISS